RRPRADYLLLASASGPLLAYRRAPKPGEAATMDFQRHERGPANLIVIGFLAVVGLTALLFLIARIGLLPPGMLGPRPPGVVVALANTPTPTPPPRGTPVPAAAPAQPTATMAPTPSGPRPSVTE